MKTDDLIAALSAHVEPVDRRSVGRTVGLALAAATVLTLGGILVGLGTRSDLTTGHAVVSVLVRGRNRRVGIGLPDATGAAGRRT